METCKSALIFRLGGLSIRKLGVRIYENDPLRHNKHTCGNSTRNACFKSCTMHIFVLLYNVWTTTTN